MKYRILGENISNIQRFVPLIMPESDIPVAARMEIRKAVRLIPVAARSVVRSVVNEKPVICRSFDRDVVLVSLSLLELE